MNDTCGYEGNNANMKMLYPIDVCGHELYLYPHSWLDVTGVATSGGSVCLSTLMTPRLGSCSEE